MTKSQIQLQSDFNIRALLFKVKTYHTSSTSCIGSVRPIVRRRRVSIQDCHTNV